MLANIAAVESLRGLARRKGQPDEYRTVRNQLVDEELGKGWVVVKRNKASTRIRKPKTHHRLLEDRVWTLMYRMGFRHLSEDGGAFQLVNSAEPHGPDSQIDVVAIDDEVAFACECKSSQQPRKLGDFRADLAKHVALRDGFTKAVRAQFPSPAKKAIVFAIWTSNLTLSENDRTRASEVGVPLFTDGELQYYERLVDQVGTAARFQFLADVLASRAIPGLEIKVPAIKAKMGGSVAYTFGISPEYLLKIAFVSHRAKGGASDVDTYQRMLKKSRLTTIRQYITQGGIFPTNIVVNIAQAKWLQFDRGKQQGDSGAATFGWLTIRAAYRIAWIIDGQHRLFAYAGHPNATKAMVSVLAFVGLPPSEQAGLFVEINAEQRKVKQSLLQTLYAELHWDAAEPEVRLRAILSKVVQALDSDLDSPFFERILKADDKRTNTRCISLTAVFGALENTQFFIARIRKGQVLEYGPLWAGDNLATLRRTKGVLYSYFTAIQVEAATVWDLGAADGGGLAMNDGVTMCIMTLKSIFEHITSVRRLDLHELGDEEIGKLVAPYGAQIGRYFKALSVDQIRAFRKLRGVQGQTAGMRRLQLALRADHPNFNPIGLDDFVTREKAQTNAQAYDIISHIEVVLQQTVVEELKRELGKDEDGWWFGGVPKDVRMSVDERRNEEGGKNTREQNFNLIDYRKIIEKNWQIFEPVLARGKGSKDSRTRWLANVNELRKIVMHPSKGVHMPISLEQLTELRDVEAWLTMRDADEGETDGGAQE